MIYLNKEEKEFLDYCRWIAIREYKKKGNLTIDDVRDQVKVPDGVNAKVFELYLIKIGK